MSIKNDIGEELWSVSETAESFGISRSTVHRLLAQEGYILVAPDPKQPETYYRVTEDMIDALKSTFKDRLSPREKTVEQLGELLTLSDTTIRRYIRLGVIKEYQSVKYPRHMYAFTPDQQVQAKKRINLYEELKRQGFRSLALTAKMEDEWEAELKKREEQDEEQSS